MQPTEHSGLDTRGVVSHFAVVQQSNTNISIGFELHCSHRNRFVLSDLPTPHRHTLTERLLIFEFLQ